MRYNAEHVQNIQEGLIELEWELWIVRKFLIYSHVAIEIFPNKPPYIHIITRKGIRMAFIRSDKGRHLNY